MTVSVTTSKHTYDGNDVTTLWDYSFEIQQASDIEVFLTNDAGEDQDALILDSDYTVDTSNAQVLYPASGSPLATGWKITVRRLLPLTQGLDLKNRGALNAENLEKAYDKLCMIAQQLEEQIDRAITFQASSSSSGVTVPEPQAGSLLGWDEDGEKLTNYPGFNGLSVQGSWSSPAVITAAGGITPSNASRDETIFIVSDGGDVDVSATDQIADGVHVGQIITLIATDDTDRVMLETGNNLLLKGAWRGSKGDSITLRWTGATVGWVEMGRN